MPFHTHIHIVMSPRDLPDPAGLLTFIEEHATEWIVAIEKGANGHEHYDAFIHLKKDHQKRRLDSLKRSLLKHYPEIPEKESKNIRLCVNSIDPNPLYGYGYSSKEDNIIATTFDSFFIADALDYYQKHRDKVDHAKHMLSENRKGNKYIDADDIAKGAIKFVRDYYGDIKLTNDHRYEWLIEEYLKTLLHKELILFTTYQKINEEKLVTFVRRSLVAGLLDSPPTQSPPITHTHHHECTIHPLLISSDVSV